MRNTNKLHAKPKPKLLETCTEVIRSFRPARKLVIYTIYSGWTLYVDRMAAGVLGVSLMLMATLIGELNLDPCSLIQHLPMELSMHSFPW
jgi:hypothetical protein